LNGFCILIPNVPTDIARRLAYLTASISFQFLINLSKNNGAYEKSLAIDYKWDYFLNI
jgi:hypothetical protein